MLREFFYGIILVGGTSILTALELLHSHEAFLVAGVLALIALLLVEPSGKEKYTKAFINLSVLLSIYGLGLKLPMVLLGRLNYYAVYLLVFVLIGIVIVGIFILVRKHEPGLH